MLNYLEKTGTQPALGLDHPSVATNCGACTQEMVNEKLKANTQLPGSSVVLRETFFNKTMHSSADDGSSSSLP